ncbi:amidohydrolase family protein [Beijerinckia sp. L45]|uniref:amidohydrolase family protein n=1 Tax=Beijerinckia sp. L45 TaxID=1641855 RepID=UPI00131B1DCE|nr:amidohydrolase family protein [Beijerinckia sp. L45]
MDAGGLLITPGFVNAHCHSHDTLLRGLFEQLPLDLWGLVAFPFYWPRRGTEEVAVRTRLHAAECLRGGMTTIQDMVTLVDFDRDHADAVAAAYAESGISAIVAPQFSDRRGSVGVPFADESLSPHARTLLGTDTDPEAIQTALLTLFDAVAAPRFAWALGPVQPQNCSDALLHWVARTASERALSVFTHLYETRSEAVLARTTLPDHGGSAVRRLQHLGLLTPRLTIAHGVWIRADEIDVLAAHGTSLATNPVTNLKLMNGLAPVRRYRQAGVTIGLGCDNSSASDAQSMFQAMKLFALAWGLQTGGNDQAAATEAFRAATMGGAAAVGRATSIGRIAPGYSADLVFIDLDDPSWLPLNSAVRQLVYGETGRAVRHVMVQGELVVRDRRLIRFDPQTLRDDAERIQGSMAADLADCLKPDRDVIASYARVSQRADAFGLDIEATPTGWSMDRHA